MALIPFRLLTVCYLAKILHWKQFTTIDDGVKNLADCLLSRKDTTLKAIHNRPSAWKDTRRLFAISQRYYIESNSQHTSTAGLYPRHCLLSRKDTTLKAIHNQCLQVIFYLLTVCYLAKILHWKQFTTVTDDGFKVRPLFAISQRYYIESNSQLVSVNGVESSTVCYLAKILHWKQFTTGFGWS